MTKLRVGLLLDSFDIPSWSYLMLEKIIESEYAELVLIIKNDSKKEEEQGLVKKILDKREQLFYNLYRKLDRKIFSTSNDAFKRKNIQELIDLPIVSVLPRKTKFCDWIEKDDLKKIEEFAPDILIRMGFRILKGGILALPNYGIWSYHHGDNKVNRGGPPGFWEVMNEEAETGVVLQILSNKLDGGKILYKSFSLTDKISVHRNTNNYYWKAASFIPRKLCDLYQHGENDFFLKLNNINPDIDFYSNKLYTPPSNGTVMWLLFKKGLKELKKRLNDLLYFDQWILLFKFDKAGDLSSSLYQFKEIIPPKDRIWADPILFSKEGRNYIFIEEMLTNQGKGWISVLEINENGEYTEPKKVFEKETHLSYPYILEDKGEIYMLPETKRTKTVEIYKAVDFPLKWKLQKIILNNITAVDPTVLKYNDKYWLFVNTVDNIGASAHDELFIYYSDELLSDTWTSHPQNPVVSDVKKSRPAGRPFWYKNNLYRPSQNCSNFYGYGITVNKIKILNVLSYEEVVVDSLTPDWDKRIKGIHTFSFENNLTVVDGLRRTRKF